MRVHDVYRGDGGASEDGRAHVHVHVRVHDVYRGDGGASEDGCTDLVEIAPKLVADGWHDIVEHERQHHDRHRGHHCSYVTPSQQLRVHIGRTQRHQRHERREHAAKEQGVAPLDLLLRAGKDRAAGQKHKQRRPARGRQRRPTER